MKHATLAAIAALSIGFSLPAFAAEEQKAQELGAYTSMEMLGIDVDQAGTTNEQRMAFWMKMPTDQQTSVKQKCSEAMNNKDAGLTDGFQYLPVLQAGDPVDVCQLLPVVTARPGPSAGVFSAYRG